LDKLPKITVDARINNIDVLREIVTETHNVCVVQGQPQKYLSITNTGRKTY
jgi:hypothetical protein